MKKLDVSMLYTGSRIRFKDEANSECQFLSYCNDKIIANKKGKEVEILEGDFSRLESLDEIRFITPNYQTLFTVHNFDFVLFRGKKRQVVFVDDYHFLFSDDKLCHHICWFAEYCNQNGNMVTPLSEQPETSAVLYKEVSQCIN